jgi:hypothetical protein
MEHSVSTEWSLVMAVLQMFFGAALLLTCKAGYCSALRSFLRTCESYFYSFSPVLLLCYILYKVSFFY